MSVFSEESNVEATALRDFLFLVFYRCLNQRCRQFIRSSSWPSCTSESPSEFSKLPMFRPHPDRSSLNLRAETHTSPLDKGLQGISLVKTIVPNPVYS